jgi:hypothetical protein
MTRSVSGPKTFGHASSPVKPTSSEQSLLGTLGFGASRPLRPDEGFVRHLEGWELASVAVGIALTLVLLVLPRAESPSVLPVPRIDRSEQRRAAGGDLERAAAAEHDELPFEVRAVGEALRRYGLAAGAGSGYALNELHYLRVTAQAARKQHGDESLLRLRAVQTKMFLAALADWEATGLETDDLKELGGDFLDKARSSGWIAEKRQLLPSEPERATLFRVRWSELAGLREQHPFSPSLNEWRIYFRFLLEHPDVAASTPRRRAERRLEYIEALGKLDPEFPAAFARGVLEYELRHYARAAQAFRAHLGSHPTGPWELRARNHLAAAERGLVE